MKLSDKAVYVVAYRDTSDDEWETSGLTYGNVLDAVVDANSRKFHNPDKQTQIFKYDTPVPVEHELHKG